MSLSRDQSPTVEVTGKEDAVKNARSNVMTRLETQAKLVSERLPVEKIYHPFVCGPNNAIIKRLMDETGARINVPPFRVQKDEIVVSGEKDDVIWCKATIMRIYQEKKSKCQTMSFEVRKSQHKYVIGPHGNNLQEILANTGVSVEVPLLDSPSETITLRGEQEQLGLALTMVHSKANNVIYADVNAPNWLHRFIIGNKGENIRRITQVCPKVHFKFLEGQDKIQVTGPREEVEIGVAELHDYVKDLQSRMDFAEVEIEQRFHKYIIGKAGANIRKLRNETGVMIRIPPDAENSPIIRIEGDPKRVERAKQELMEMASRMANNAVYAYAPNWMHRFIIGKKGENIRRITQVCPQVHFKFLEGQDKIQVTGPREEVDQAVAELNDHVRDLESRMYFAEVEIEQRFHKYVIGKAGVNIRKITNETGVIIRIPPDAENSPIIRILGDPKRVERAKQELMEMASRMPISKAGNRHILIGEGSYKNDSKSYKCNVCDKRFSTKSRMEQHKRQDKDFNHHGCKFCSKRLFTKTKMRRQKNCEKGYTTEKEQWQHLDYKDFRRFECDICDEEHSAKRKLWQHLRHHKDIRRYKCDVCDDKYSAKWEPSQHLRPHKDFRCYECDVCGKGYSTQRGLWKHLSHHKDFRRYECDFCDEGCSTKWELWQHLHCDKDFRCYECKICDKGYSTLMSLWQHLRHHKDCNPYESCVFVERFTKTTKVEEYQRHRQEFTLYEIGGFEEIFSKMGEVDLYKSDRCKVCGKRFFQISELEQHKKHHKDFNTYKCDICDKRFSTMKEMEEHRRHHKDIRLYQCCRLCGAIFSTMSEMEKHNSQHKVTDVRPYQCDVCDKKFSTKNGMEAHKRHHQGSMVLSKRQ